MSILVYEYWCEPATDTDRDLLMNQLRLASETRREMARMENLRRYLFRAAQDKATRTWIWGHHAEAIKTLRAKYSDLGLTWGTYQHVEESADASAEDTLLCDDVRTWFSAGEGAVAVHLQPPRALRGDSDRWAKVGTTLVRHGSPLMKNGQPRPSRHTEVSIRVGSNPDRSPQWATVHALLHRPLPAQGVVSRVRVHARRIATKTRWVVQFVVDDLVRPVTDITKPLAVGIDIGWRKHPDGNARIAYWVGSDGDSGELVIPEACWGRDPKSDSLRSIRNLNRNEVQRKLLAYRASVTDPDWLAMTGQLYNTTKFRKYVALLNWWRSHRHDGDQAAFEELQAWAKQDRHLWEWEANNRKKREAYVDDATRKFVAHLCQRYQRVGVEAPMLADMKRRKGDGRCDGCRGLPKRCGTCFNTERQRELNAKRIQTLAPANVRLFAEQAAAKFGAAAIRVEPAHTTLLCSRCGYLHAKHQLYTVERVVQCCSCGAEYDQDENASINLMRVAMRAILVDGKPVGSNEVVVRERKQRKTTNMSKKKVAA